MHHREKGGVAVEITVQCLSCFCNITLNYNEWMSCHDLKGNDIPMYFFALANRIQVGYLQIEHKEDQG